MSPNQPARLNSDEDEGEDLRVDSTAEEQHQPDTVMISHVNKPQVVVRHKK
jgi:hypothetical protein